MATTKETKDLIIAAKKFVKQKHGGLSGRIRERLEEIKPALAILVNERVSIQHIKEFIQTETGMRIGTTPLRQYCEDALNYSARAAGETKKK